MGPLTFNLYS